MSAPETTTCPRCGAPLQSTPCPACMMSRALASSSAETLPVQPDQPAPDRWREPARFPSQFGGYRLLGVLGRGGMGTVYEAEQIDTGRRVALKILEHELDSLEMRKRFLREGRLAAAVSHPNTVYVFGTEEIGDQPVIVMEVADGGTLKALVKRHGHLPIAEAVDAILDVIAGLEAAHARGVLHRDVKPSNCFLTPDRSVKVGDFGLSVSTLTKTDTFLTASGAMLGTPSYAPPEQLRGDELDLRADIYSVGATLFTLLTGKAPFEGENAVQVVAAVLNEKPKVISDLRSDVPAGLAQAVARCLAKRPEARFPNYQSLRSALLPFGSRTPDPAPLANRFLAGFIDQAVATLPTPVIMAIYGKDHSLWWLGEQSLPSALPWLLASLFYILYHAVPEGLWGASLGKAILGLRVARPGGRRPGLGRALLRATIALLALEAGVLFSFCTMTAAEYRQAWAADAFMVGEVLFLFTWWSLFLTMRRRNGFANLMDLASGTRVILKTEAAARPATGRDVLPSPTTTNGSMGPYGVIEKITPHLIAGYDPTLRRHVWLQRPVREDLDPSRRELARPGRLRWLQDLAIEEETWRVFEAPAGAPLRSSNPVPRNVRHPWAAVRHWLHDLAEELDAASKDQSLPPRLSLDHVWITTTGRAILLDEPWPRFDPPAEPFSSRETISQQQFLWTVAQQADPTTIPLYARSTLRNLAAGTFEKISFLAGTLRALLTKPAELRRPRRAASILTAPLVALAILSFMVLLIIRLERTEAELWTARHPDLPALSGVLLFRMGLEPLGDSAMLRAVDTHLAGHYRHLADSLALPAGTDPALGLDEEQRLILLDIVRGHSAVTPEALTQADQTLQFVLPEFLRQQRLILSYGPLLGFLTFLAAIALVQLLSLLLFRSSPGQILFGFAVVTDDGQRAGRPRLLGRWLLVWLPLLLLLHALTSRLLDPPPVWSLPASLTLATALACLWGLIQALARPNRGLHDQLAKTWLVPR